MIDKLERPCAAYTMVGHWFWKRRDPCSKPACFHLGWPADDETAVACAVHAERILLDRLRRLGKQAVAHKLGPDCLMPETEWCMACNKCEPEDDFLKRAEFRALWDRTVTHLIQLQIGDQSPWQS